MHIKIHFNCSECLGEHLTISNSAAGVLAHLVAEPSQNWTVDVPSHSDVREDLRETINSWDINEKRNVRYRYVYDQLTVAEDTLL